MNELVEFKCTKCNKPLVWTFENAQVQCNSCFTWIRFKDLKNPNPPKISALDAPEQLEMFR